MFDGFSKETKISEPAWIGARVEMGKFLPGKWIPNQFVRAKVELEGGIDDSQENYLLWSFLRWCTINASGRCRQHQPECNIKETPYYSVFRFFCSGSLPATIGFAGLIFHKGLQVRIYPDRTLHQYLRQPEVAWPMEGQGLQLDTIKVFYAFLSKSKFLPGAFRALSLYG